MGEYRKEKPKYSRRRKSQIEGIESRVLCRSLWVANYFGRRRKSQIEGIESAYEENGDIIPITMSQKEIPD